MSTKRINRIKSDVNNAVKKACWSNALSYSLELAQEYIDNHEFERAEAVYIGAIDLFPKIVNVTEEDRDNEYMRLRKLVEIFAEEDYCNPKKVEENFAELVVFAEESRPRLERRVQITYHVGAFCYHLANPLDIKRLKKAKQYALKSLKLLDKNSRTIDTELKAAKDTDDSTRRRSGIYAVLAAIFYDMGDFEQAIYYNEQALQFERLHPDPDLRYRILFSKHGFVPRDQRLQISRRLYSLVEEHHKSSCEASKDLWTSRRIEILPILAKDVLIEGNLNESKKLLWMLYDIEKSNLFVKEGLVTIAKLETNQAKIDKLSEKAEFDQYAIAKLYEKCGDIATAFDVIEMARDYYEQMRLIAISLPGDRDFGNLELTRLATTSLAETFMELRDYQTAATFFDDVIEIETRLACGAITIFQSKLSSAIAKSKCSGLSFNEKFETFQKLLDVTSRGSKKQTLEKLVEFLVLERDPIAEDHLPTYEAELNAMKHVEDDDDDDIVDDETIENAADDENENDDDIFENLLKKHHEEELIKQYKSKRDKRNIHGETELHVAAKTNNLKFVKMLVQKCAYDIDARDSGGWTPLSEAVTHRQVSIVKYLVQRGANLNTRATTTLMDDDGNHATAEGPTPLMEACINGDLVIINILLEGGADVLLKNESGRTAADYIEEYLKTTGCDDVRDSLNVGLTAKMLKMRKIEREAGMVGVLKKPDLPEVDRKRSVQPLVRKTMVNNDAPAVMQYQVIMGSLGARTKTKTMLATERDVTSLTGPDDQDDVEEAMEVGFSMPRRRPSEDENDVIVDDVIPISAKRSTRHTVSKSSEPAPKRKRLMEDFFDADCIIKSPTQTRLTRMSSGISSSSGTSSMASVSTTITPIPVKNIVLNCCFYDHISKLPIAKVTSMKCAATLSIGEICDAVKDLMDDVYEEIVPCRGVTRLQIHETIADVLKGAVVRTFDLKLMVKGWVPPDAKKIFTRFGVAISRNVAKIIMERRSKHWTLDGIFCHSRTHLPRFLQALALMLADRPGRVPVESMTLGPDSLLFIVNPAKPENEPYNLNDEIANAIGILLRGKSEIKILGYAVEDVWLERIVLDQNSSKNADKIVINGGQYTCHGLASFLEHCGSPVTLDLSWNSLKSNKNATYDDVIEQICRFPRLETLKLAGLPFTTMQIQRILNVCPNLLNLDISNMLVDLEILKGDNIVQLDASKMKSKNCDLSLLSSNFPKLKNLDVSLGTASVADVLRHFGTKQMNITALFCSTEALENVDFESVVCRLLVNSTSKSVLLDAGLSNSKLLNVAIKESF